MPEFFEVRLLSEDGGVPVRNDLKKKTENIYVHACKESRDIHTPTCMDDMCPRADGELHEEAQELSSEIRCMFTDWG